MIEMKTIEMAMRKMEGAGPARRTSSSALRFYHAQPAILEPGRATRVLVVLNVT
jgi:hypothetical protein